MSEKDIQGMNTFGTMSENVVKNPQVTAIVNSSRQYLVGKIQKQIKFCHRRFVTLSYHMPLPVFSNLVFKHVDEESFKFNWLPEHKTKKGKLVPESTRLGLEIDLNKCIDIFGVGTANEMKINDRGGSCYYRIIVFLDANDNSTMRMKYCVETEELHLRFNFQLYRKLNNRIILI